MKQRSAAVLCVIASLFILSHPLYACSSFAVYAERPIYGMNFDYDNCPMKFLISETDGIKTFHLAFQRPIKGNMIWVRTAGMNDKGLFASCQEELPYTVNPPHPKDGEIYIHQLYTQLDSYGKTEEVLNICSMKKLVQHEAVSVHNLFADKYGNAVVTEATANGNRLMKINGGFIVMTNFPNRSIEGESYKKAKGTGDERYIMAHEFIQEHKDEFDINYGMTVLEKIRMTQPTIKTSCSMVFDPQNNAIYIAVKQNYHKIFKVSLNNSTIETLRGFGKYQKTSLDSEGILFSSLTHWD